MSKPITLRRLLLLTLALTGCASAPKAASDGSPSLALELFTRSTDFRYTWFTLDPAGQLSFAGGRDAGLREGKPVKTLSPQERDELWSIIRRHDLLHAKGAGLFKEGEKITYELNLKTGEGNRELRAIDDQLPGVAELHDALFRMQASVRYNLPGIK